MNMKMGALMTLCAALLCAMASAAAETALHASVGYDAVILSGRPVPLSVEITADEAPVEGMLSVDVAVSSGKADRFRQPVSVPAGETRTYRMPVCPSVNQRTFEVTLSCAGASFSATARAARAVPEDALVIGVLSEKPKPLAQALSAIELQNVRGEREQIEAIALDAEEFARDARGMSAFDAVVVLDQAAHSLDAARTAVLEDWQRTGGILVHKSAADSLAPELAARQIMAEIKAAQKDGQIISHDFSNYPYSVGLNLEMRADQPGSLFPAAALLVVYVLFAGVGAYLLMKRLDRSKILWAVLPASAVAACALMALLGALLGVNRPMSSSVHLVQYGDDGKAHVSELAMLTYAGQTRKSVATQDNVPLERMAYTIYNGYESPGEEMELRDVMTLGDHPAIELEGKADWLVRKLVVRSDAAPQGRVTAFAHMEEDGLHVEAENDTDVTIENAVLITQVGYALLGDLAPGAQAQAVLLRTDETPWDEKGNVLVREGQMLPMGVSLYVVCCAAVDPENVSDPSWARSSLPKAEQTRRQWMNDVLELGTNAGRGTDFDCVLIGETPQIACQTLVLDGEPVTRRAQKSVLSCTAAFETVSSSGYFYYPEKTFRCLNATLDENGVPVLGKACESGYIYEKGEVLLGFRLSGVQVDGIEEIRLRSTGGVSGGDNVIAIESYDYTDGQWVPLAEDGVIRIDGALAGRVVSPSGELCLRLSGEKMAEWGLYLPEIIVEGRQSEAREGGDAA